MKTIVVYQSSTGFTGQYARWIAAELGCEAVDSKRVSESEIAACDWVIHGGWLMGNTIKGLDKIKKLAPEKLIVFGVGVTPDSAEFRQVLREQNHMGEMPLFYMEGGIRYEKLNFFSRTMLKAVKKALSRKPDKTEQEIIMEKGLGASFDHSNKQNIKELVTYVQGLPQ